MQGSQSCQIRCRRLSVFFRMSLEKTSCVVLTFKEMVVTGSISHAMALGTLLADKTTPRVPTHFVWVSRGLLLTYQDIPGETTRIATKGKASDFQPKKKTVRIISCRENIEIKYWNNFPVCSATTEWLGQETRTHGKVRSYYSCLYRGHKPEGQHPEGNRLEHWK